jgi:hypothetical protein
MHPSIAWGVSPREIDGRRSEHCSTRLLQRKARTPRKRGWLSRSARSHRPNRMFLSPSAAVIEIEVGYAGLARRFRSSWHLGGSVRPEASCLLIWPRIRR